MPFSKNLRKINGILVFLWEELQSRRLAPCCIVLSVSNYQLGRVMPYHYLLYDTQDTIVTLTLNRPDRLNALGDTLREELCDALGRASADPAARVIVITGAGRGFCAGGDMKAAHEVQEGVRERALLDRVAPLRDKVVLTMR